MRITVCETAHGPAAESAWSRLSAHTREARSDLVLLPEFAFLEPVWEQAHFDATQWAAIEQAAAGWLARLPELGGAQVIGSMPVTVAGQRLNRGFHWSADGGLQALRSKHHLPDEPGGWEARWFSRGAPDFPLYAAGPLRFGLNICTELWALETAGAYARAGAHAIVTPRATAAATVERWVALAKTMAVRAGAFSLSSNRRHADGSCGGTGWIIDPEGREQARTSASQPAVTVAIDLDSCAAAQAGYPRYVFAAG